MNCIIIHGCPSSEEEMMKPKSARWDQHWMPWAKKELESRGIRTEIPLMPTPWAPDYEKFKREFEKHEVTENTILIGHSCGCAFLVRWLGETKRRIRQLILVAPWKIPPEGDAGREAYYGFAIDKTIPKRAGKIVMFTSDNEEEDGKKSLKEYHRALGGKTIELKGRGHYTIGDMGTPEFPELISEVA